MNKDLVIEHYLSRLDRELQALPTGQRAEIITEIRSHILEASDKDPAKNIQTLLDDIGTPKDVAIKYLQQKGVKYSAPGKPRDWLRIFALSVVGLFASAVIAVLFTVWYFSPLVKVDEAKGRVTLFGGAIDVSDQGNGKVKIGDSFEITGGDEDDGNVRIKLNGAGISKSKGEEDLAARKVTKVKIPFNTAKLDIHPSPDRVFKWRCKNLSANPPPISVSAGTLTLDLNKVNTAKCDLRLPEGLTTEIKGVNGALELHKPSSSYDIKVTNGKIDINPDASRVYDFEVNVANGLHDSFARSGEKGALKVKVDVINGVVKKASEENADGDEDVD